MSNIWIVDNVALKVFQYNGAATRTSGSQTAAATFALAAGNTNPQDIADPPVGLSQLTPSGAGAPSVVTIPVPLPPFSGISLSNTDLDSLFAAMARDFDLNGDDDASFTTKGAGSLRSRVRTR